MDVERNKTQYGAYWTCKNVFCHVPKWFYNDSGGQVLATPVGAEEVQSQFVEVCMQCKTTACSSEMILSAPPNGRQVNQVS